MRVSRFYQTCGLDVGQTITLDERSSHYLVRVLRLKVDDDVILFNGSGAEFLGRIATIKRLDVTVTLSKKTRPQTESHLSLHLMQAVVRGEKMDWVLQKAVELGVTAITPVMTERCAVKLDAKRLQKRMEHWQGVIISACEQSGRVSIPILKPPVSLGPALVTTESEVKFVLAPTSEKPLAAFKKDKITSASLLVGPEGGLTTDELEAASQSGFTPVSLGPRILRTETAPIAALSLCQLLWGDF